MSLKTRLESEAPKTCLKTQNLVRERKHGLRKHVLVHFQKSSCIDVDPYTSIINVSTINPVVMDTSFSELSESASGRKMRMIATENRTEIR